MPRRAAPALLLALLATAASAAEPVRIPGPDGTTLRALLVPAAPGSPPAAPVVALHGCGGLGGPGIPLSLPAREADWAGRLARLGHPVLFPDSFGSRGVAQVCTGDERGILPQTTRRADALAAAWVASRPWAVPGGALLLGWSHGGSAALAAAGAPVPRGLLRGAVALYPGCVRPGRPLPAWAPAVPVLMLLGEADEWTPPAPCRALAARAGAGVTVAAFPGAHHGFDQPATPLRTLTGLSITPRGDGRARTGTDPAARAAALERVPAFLAAHGAAGGGAAHGGAATRPWPALFHSRRDTWYGAAMTPPDTRAATPPAVAIGGDHAGVDLRAALACVLEQAGHAVHDCGTGGTASVDYPDFADAVAAAVLDGRAGLGVLVCGTGIGIAIAANRHPGIRCALAHDATTARLAREHNDANVLALGARTTGPEVALDALRAFLATPYAGGRHERRVAKLSPDRNLPA